jgi:hypothetical protein
MSVIRSSMNRLGVLLLAICRTLYCWMFLCWSAALIYAFCSNIRSLVRTHSVERGDVITNVSFAVYSIVLAIAWWMILRGKPALKQWAIAANIVFIFNYLPALVTGNWRGVFEAEREWWPVILVGIIGIIIFSIPYKVWRYKAQIPAN